MDSTLQALSQIAQAGGPALLIAVMWIGYRAMRSAEKAVEAFTAMRTDIAEIKAAVSKSLNVETLPSIEKKLVSIDDHMEENGRKLDKLVARAA